MPRFIGLIGYPLKHSVSPYFQQAALDYYQLDIRYQAWETPPETLESRVKALRKRENIGANVTLPYKQKVLPLLDWCDETSSLIGAVNTVVNDSGKLLGFNTDAAGFIKALKEQGHFDPEGKRVVVLGAGGAARAVTFALLQNRVSSLIILNRTFERAKALVDALNEYGRNCVTLAGKNRTEVLALPWEALTSAETFHNCHLIVNCTTIGMKHDQEESPLRREVIPKGVLVYDLVYNPRPTMLLRLAQEAGASILDGLPMLVYQGAASFELWTKKRAPIELMLKVAEEALKGGEW
jgi:shikimate dehydrogenase